MPPGHHSSSSHHSSHSHSSSRSSSHSHSSHSSSGGGRSRYERTMRRQPKGYPAGLGKPKTFNYKKHSYNYYTQDWTDTKSGKYYKKGYYDEHGNYYKNLILQDKNKYSTQCDCEYCGTHIRLNWEKGALPNCPNCAATLNVMEDAAIDIYPYHSNRSFQKVGNIVLVVFMSLIFFLGFIAAPAKIAYRRLVKNNDKKVQDTSNIDIWGEEIYVESIGRTIKWNDEYESYYDSTSDCYVYYNTEVDPNVWQYWYEDISSDFGDYGWMEYEIAEDQWYIEKSEGNWVKLPSRYDTDELWHFEGEQAGDSYVGLDNTYLFGEEITIDGYEFEWDDVAQSYYNEDLDCFIWYNTDVDPYVWQYYHSSVSGSKEFKKYGWMEYDENEEIWYIETKDGWIVLPDEYDGDSLWHMEKEPEYDIHE